jgi:hypothetical protein
LGGDRSNDVLGDDFDERPFSYRGLDAGGRPLPYSPQDTHRPLPALVREMASQVEALRSATGQDVDIVADSEGSVVAAAYVAGAADSPVDRTLLLSPLVEPGRVSFPERGEEGWGVATGWILRGVSGVVRATTSVEVAPDSPFSRSLVDEAPVLRDLLRCPPPGIDELALLPLADAVVSAHPTALSIGDSVVPHLPRPHARRRDHPSGRGARPRRRGAAGAQHLDGIGTARQRRLRRVAGADPPDHARVGRRQHARLRGDQGAAERVAAGSAAMTASAPAG